MCATAISVVYICRSVASYPTFGIHTKFLVDAGAAIPFSASLDRPVNRSEMGEGNGNNDGTMRRIEKKKLLAL